MNTKATNADNRNVKMETENHSKNLTNLMSRGDFLKTFGFAFAGNVIISGCKKEEDKTSTMTLKTAATGEIRILLAGSDSFTIGQWLANRNWHVSNSL